MKIIKQIAVLSVVIGLLLVGLNALLGGFREPEYSLREENTTYQLVGRYFKGRIQEEEPQDNFFAVQKLLVDSVVQGEMVVLYWQHPEDNRGMLEQFTAVMLTEPLAQVPEGMELREVTLDVLVRAKMTMHAMVRPSPAKVRENLGEFAQQKGYSLDSVTLERYYPDGSLVVDIPVVDTQSFR